MWKIVVPIVSFLTGIALLLAWTYQVFGDWATFIIGALLVSGGAFGLLDVFEDHREIHG